MTRLAVTGATGHLGRLVVESLLDRGVPASDVVAIGRDTARLDDLAARGVTVRRADYDEPATLDPALAGVERLLLVSGSEVGRRLPQHTAVVEAAQRAGVSLLVYTSAPNADTAAYTIAQEHRATEELLAASGLDHVVLRNGWYLENYTAQLPTYLEHGVVGAAGDGRIAAATRADLAEAAAVVLTSEGYAGRVLDLGGPGFTLGELAAEVAAASGREVGYTDLPEQQLVEVLVGAGVPRPFAASLADADADAARGALDLDPHDLEALLGRPATTLREAVRRAL
jgi:NAD(P)H dehydrogenase (quinone)